MKATIRIENNDGKKLAVAARNNGVKLGDVIPFSPSESFVELDYKSGEDLFNCARQIDKVTGNEYDKYDAALAAKKKAAEEKAAKAKK